MILSALIFTIVGQASKLVGADQLIREAKAASLSAPNDPVANVRLEIAALRHDSGTLSAPEAASRWLALIDHWSAVNPPQSNDAVKLEDVVSALPPPESWPLIRAGIDTRASDKLKRVLTMLFGVLLDNPKAAITECEEMRNTLPTPLNMDFDQAASGLDSIEEPLAERVGELQYVTPILNRSANRFAAFFMSGFPDLLAIFGPEEGRVVLTGMLESAKNDLGGISRLPRVARVARSIQMMDAVKMRCAQWSLATGPQAQDFVAAMVRRFGEDAFFGSSQQVGTAPWLYVSSLITAGHMEHAIRLTEKRTDYWSENCGGLGFSEAQYNSLFRNFREMLSKDPGLNAWDFYSSLGTRLGRASEVRTQMGQALQVQGLPQTAKQWILISRAILSLKLGDGKQGLSDLVAIQKAGSSQYEIGEMLVRYADATGNVAALNAALEVLKREQPSMQSWSTEIVSTLISEGRFGEAQAILLEAGTQPQPMELGGMGSSRSGLQLDPTLPISLAELYYKAGRPKDIITLLNDYPAWGQDDLSDAGCYACTRNDLGFDTAWAFAKTGRTPLAIRDLHNFLAGIPPNNAAAVLLNQLEGVDALSYYDQLTKQNPFNSRPLTWKADLLRRLGRLKEAEREAKTGIALNPVDGEYSNDHRFFGYQVLADIMKAEGRTSEESRCRHIVEEAVLSGASVKYEEAELYPQAVSMLKQALALYPEDCLTQFSLAEVLHDEGKNDDALQAEKRGFELLAKSIGEQATYRIDYEVDLDNPEANAIAQGIFKEQLSREPKNPQLHYLLGEALKHAGDPSQALPLFEQAVRLDPRYFDAWNAILELGKSRVPSPGQLEEAQFRTIELDPSRSTQISYVQDYAKLYRLFEVQSQSVAAAPLFPLHKAPAPQGYTVATVSYSATSDGPGSALAKVGEIQSICNLYGESTQ